MAELATIARPYAEALFKASAGEDAPSFADQLDTLAQVAGHAQLRQFADSPKVSAAQVFELVTGVARLALATGAPVVPIGVSLDPAQIVFRDSVIDGVAEHVRWYCRGPYFATVGAAMAVTGSLEDRENVRTATARIMSRIVSLAQRSTLRLRTDGRQNNRSALQPGFGQL